MVEFQQARKNMVDCQLRPNNVTNKKLLDCFLEMPREAFMPEAFKGCGYLDEDFEIAPGRYLTEPVVLAHMIEAAALKEDDIVLVVGAATGYSSALIAQFTSTVVALEERQDFLDIAQQGLEETDIQNVVSVVGSLSEGYGAQAPYDVIFIDGGVGDFPNQIAGQLSEGGRLIFVQKDTDKTGLVVCATLKNGAFDIKKYQKVQVPYLAGFEKRPKFKF